MAAYPNYGILLESSRESESKWRDDVAETGTLHSRQLRSTEYIFFSLLHNMTTAEFRALETTYRAGERDTYTLTYFDESPAKTYSVKFLSPPQIVKNHTGGRHNVRVELRGTQD
jgi:hypothetical protein